MEFRPSFPRLRHRRSSAALQTLYFVLALGSAARLWVKSGREREFHQLIYGEEEEQRESRSANGRRSRRGASGSVPPHGEEAAGKGGGGAVENVSTEVPCMNSVTMSSGPGVESRVWIGRCCARGVQRECSYGPESMVPSPDVLKAYPLQLLSEVLVLEN